MGMGKRRTWWPTWVGVGLLLALSLWVMHEVLRLSAAQRHHQRRVGEMALALVREMALPGDPPPTGIDWASAAARVASVAEEAGIVHVEVASADGVLMCLGEDPFPRPPRGPSGCRDHGARLQVWDTVVLPVGGEAGIPAAAASGKAVPVRLLLVLDLGKGLPAPGGVDRLAAIVLALGGGVVTVFLLAWGAMARSRRLQVRLAAARTGREHDEELSLAAAGLAHETKNPLGVIRGLAQQIVADPGGAETSRRAQAIMEEADVATDRLGDFLQYARIRQPILRPLAAAPHCERVAALVADEFRAAGLGLRLELSPMFILADAEMLSQALLNLLLNSLRFTPAGGHVTLALRPSGDRLAELSVADTGSGIPEALRPGLFKPYVGQRGGHGLGLAIVKRIVDQSGWRISLDSRPGQGTVFTIHDMAILDGAET
jgi:signal transduction histidine kinase